MGNVREVGKIQINEDLEFLRKEWRAQRIGWGLLFLFVLAGLSGLLGHGPLARAHVGDHRTARVEYFRIARHSSDSDLRITVAPAVTADTLIRIYITSAYLSEFNVDDIVPEPASSGVSGDFVYYEFDREDRLRPTLITFHLRPVTYGMQHATIAINRERRLSLSQFVLP